MKRIAVGELARNVLKLPRLPIPSLAHTFDTYRSFLHPLYSADVLAPHLAKLDSFLALSAPVLQKHLEEHDRAAAESGEYPFTYVEQLLDAAQLGTRTPSEVHVNPCFVLKSGAVGAARSQAAVAAALTHATGCWISEACAHGVAVQDPSVDISPLLCEFGRCRIPGKEVDSVVTTPFTQLEHIIVLHDGHAYLVRVFDEHKNVLSRAVLQKIFEVILSITPDQDNPAPVSVLTAGSRSIWAQAYQELIKNPDNVATLQLFQQGIFVLCLDSKDGAGRTAEESGSLVARALHGGPEEVENRWYDKHQLIIDADGVAAFNFEPSLGDRVHWARWIDDLLQIVARPTAASTASTSNDAPDSAVVAQYMRPLTVTYGKSFVTHIRSARQEANTLVNDTDVYSLQLPCGPAQLAKCGMDAEAFVHLCLQMAQLSLRDRLCPASALATTTAFFHGTTELVRTATPEMQLVAEYYTRAQKSHSSTAGAASTSSASTTSAASQPIASTEPSPATAQQQKPTAGIAHDSMKNTIQGSTASDDTQADMATLATSSSQTTTRVTSTTSTSTNDKEELRRCLVAASTRHVQLMREAVRGEGIDRHLQALQDVAKLNGDKAGLAFFDDDVYRNTSTYILRTGAFSMPWLQFYVMGPGHNRGYGVGYVVDENQIRLSLCAFKNSPAIDIADMRAAILTAAESIMNSLGITPLTE